MLSPALLVLGMPFLTFVRFEDSGAVKPLFSHPTYIIPQCYGLVKFLAGVFGGCSGNGLAAGLLWFGVLCYVIVLWEKGCL